LTKSGKATIYEINTWPGLKYYSDNEYQFLKQLVKNTFHLAGIPVDKPELVHDSPIPELEAFCAGQCDEL